MLWKKAVHSFKMAWITKTMIVSHPYRPEPSEHTMVSVHHKVCTLNYSKWWSTVGISVNMSTSWDFSVRNDMTNTITHVLVTCIIKFSVHPFRKIRHFPEHVRSVLLKNLDSSYTSLHNNISTYIQLNPPSRFPIFSKIPTQNIFNFVHDYKVTLPQLWKD